MIYAVIVNELGLVGAAALLLVYLLFVARGLKTAVLARDSFSKLLATGLSFVVAMQVFVIVGGVTRVIPLTGVTLPFVAYGGSSVVMNFVLVALLLVISDRARRPYGAARLTGRAPAGERAGRRRPRGDAELDEHDAPRGSCVRRAPRQAPTWLVDLRALRMRLLARGTARRPWLARLRRALAEDLFVLHFQPIVSLADGRVAHYEALLRLADEPDGRLVAPAQFLPAAERYGLVCDIDRWCSTGRRSCSATRRSSLGLRPRREPVGAVGHRSRMLSHLQRRLARHTASIPRGW